VLGGCNLSIGFKSDFYLGTLLETNGISVLVFKSVLDPDFPI